MLQPPRIFSQQPSRISFVCPILCFELSTDKRLSKAEKELIYCWHFLFLHLHKKKVSGKKKLSLAGWVNEWGEVVCTLEKQPNVCPRCVASGLLQYDWTLVFRAWGGPIVEELLADYFISCNKWRLTSLSGIRNLFIEGYPWSGTHSHKATCNQLFCKLLPPKTCPIVIDEYISTFRLQTVFSW